MKLSDALHHAIMIGLVILVVVVFIICSIVGLEAQVQPIWLLLALPFVVLFIVICYLDYRERRSPDKQEEP